MMKIGILTLHRPANFGANLQAYSTYRYLLRRGCEVKVIDYVRDRDCLYRSVIPAVQMQAHTHFVETLLPLTRQVSSVQALRDVVYEERFDMVLIGADAVWSMPKSDNVYFAQWLFSDVRISGTKVASLAPAHMGDGFMGLSAEARNDIGQSLRQFHYVTVRDRWTRLVVNRDIFGSQPFVKEICPDPVFTLQDSLAGVPWQSNGQVSKGYYLMTLPPDWGSGRLFGKRRKWWFKKFRSLVNGAGYALVEAPLPEGRSGMSFDYALDYPIDPIQWYLWIANAKAFCGLRFHALVSAIGSGTPFYSIDSYGDTSMLGIFLDVVGCHRLARRRDGASKIANLLVDNGFRSYRTGLYLEWEAPSRVFHMLEEMNVRSILNCRDRLREAFERQMDNILR